MNNILSSFSRLSNKRLFVNLRLQQLRFLSDDKFAAGIKKGKKELYKYKYYSTFLYVGLLRADPGFLSRAQADPG